MTAMTRVQTYSAPADFAVAAGPLLAADRARSTVISTVLAGLIARPYPLPPVLAVAFDDDRPVAAALQTPPHPLTVLATPGSGMPGTWTGLAAAVHAVGAAPQIIGGPAEDARAFGAAWTRLTGARIEPHDALLLYRLGPFIPPHGVPGKARRADVEDPADLLLLAQWFHDFAVFTRVVPPSPGPDPTAVRTRAARGAVAVLWVDDDRPVAMAAHSVVVGGMARIGPVFTPEALRGRHYGSAVTAAAVESAQAAGATEIVLFTDADYPTSNAVYRRLGFARIGRFANLSATHAPVPGG